MNNKIKYFKSIRTRLFLSLCIIVFAIIATLIMLNNFVLKQFYEYNKVKQLKDVYSAINYYYNKQDYESNLSEELDKIALKNNFNILITSNENISIYSSNKDFYSVIGDLAFSIIQGEKSKNNEIEKNEKYRISKFKDSKTNMNFIMFTGYLDNSYKLYIRTPVAAIEESVKISNEFLSIIAVFVIIIGGIVLSIVSRRFSKPIIELNDITKKMSNLDFTQKFQSSEEHDEIDTLGENINILSDKLERTINQLRNTNIELEKDIEEKSQIDEMRKSFISDVSHELKTPIALIQGYSEGLIENVNSDEESRKFYAEVILDEATKMDKLVKQLLELMKLEYGKREFNNEKFDIVELVKEVTRKCNVMLEEKNIEVKFEEEKPIYVTADEFYIDQVITNYFTNAIKHAEIVDEKTLIEVKIIETSNNKIRVSVFNTGKNIDDENIQRIWQRFYKVDSSRNREDGGTGIGLSLVKAIMTNYKNDFGVINKENGVEFYFELDK